MIKQPIIYTDFNGDERKEDFYFHLSLPEITRIELEFGMSLSDYAERLSERKDSKAMIGFLERVILMSYGRKTADGRSFHKSKELREEFEHSQAYAELFEKLLTDPELARKFGEGIADNGKARKNTVAPEVLEK